MFLQDRKGEEEAMKELLLVSSGHLQRWHAGAPGKGQVKEDEGLIRAHALVFYLIPQSPQAQM